MPKITIQPTSEDEPLVYQLLIDGKRRGTIYFPTGRDGLDRLYRAKHDIAYTKDGDTHYAESLQQMLSEIGSMARAKIVKEHEPKAIQERRKHLDTYDADAIRALADRTLLDVIASDDPAALLDDLLVEDPPRSYRVCINRLVPDGDAEFAWAKITDASEVIVPPLQDCWYEVGVQFFPDGIFSNRGGPAQPTTYGHTTFRGSPGCTVRIIYSRPAARDVIHITIVNLGEEKGAEADA